MVKFRRRNITIIEDKTTEKFTFKGNTSDGLDITIVFSGTSGDLPELLKDPQIGIEHEMALIRKQAQLTDFTDD